MPLSESSLSELQKKRKTRFPLSRIKKIIQYNEDVGKTAVTVPVVLSRAIELLFDEILEKIIENTKQRGSNKIQIQDFEKTIEESKYVFLKNKNETEDK